MTNQMTYEGYLIDLDGTMYLGEQEIPEAAGFVKRLREADKNFLFLTNNSTSAPEDVVLKLNRFGIEAHEDEVFTSSMATVDYLQNNGIETVYLIGEGGIQTAVANGDIREVTENPQAVVVGLDREVTYEELKNACLFIHDGAIFIGTNPDTSLPTGEGLYPGGGALAAFIETATQVSPIFMGKPEATMMEAAVDYLGLEKEDCVMVGDNYNTDILAGLNNGIDTLMVFTGLTTKEELATKDRMPTHCIDALDAWEIN